MAEQPATFSHQHQYSDPTAIISAMRRKLDRHMPVGSPAKEAPLALASTHPHASRFLNEIDKLDKKLETIAIGTFAKLRLGLYELVRPLELEAFDLLAIKPVFLEARLRHMKGNSGHEDAQRTWAIVGEEPRDRHHRRRVVYWREERDAEKFGTEGERTHPMPSMEAKNTAFGRAVALSDRGVAEQLFNICQQADKLFKDLTFQAT
jgi:hypothetical protein